MEERELVERLTEPQRKKGMGAEEALELEATLRAIQGISLEKLLEEKAQMPMSGEELAKRLMAGKGFDRKVKAKKKPGPKKKHWAHKRKVNRAKNKRYREKRRKWLRRAKLAEAAVDAQKCYAYKLQRWLERGEDVLLTEKEWCEVVWPALGGMFPERVFRYGNEGPISLENIYIYGTKRDVVLFDGKEHALRKEGYIL